MSRREFIQRMTALGLTAASASTMLAPISCSPGQGDQTSELTPHSTSIVPGTASSTSVSRPPQSPTITPPTPTASGTYLAVARGQSPQAIVEAAVKALGGIEQFVKTGDDVVIKPNICVAYHSYE